MQKLVDIRAIEKVSSAGGQDKGLPTVSIQIFRDKIECGLRLPGLAQTEGSLRSCLSEMGNFSVKSRATPAVVRTLWAS